MSTHRLQPKIETGVKAYLAATVTGIPLPIHTTADEDTLDKTQAVLCFCPSAKGIVGLPGNYECSVRVELRTMLTFYATRAVAEAAHWALWGLVADQMMMDDLLSSIETYSDDVTVQGVDEANDIGYETREGALVSSITRTVHACPQ